MKVFQLALFFLSMISISCIVCGKGKDNPSSEKQCTKYGTDSGFLCCYVKYANGTTTCELMSYERAENLNISGTLTDSSNNYYSCGNPSNFIKFTYLLIVFLLSILF